MRPGGLLDVLMGEDFQQLARPVIGYLPFVPEFANRQVRLHILPVVIRPS